MRDLFDRTFGRRESDDPSLLDPDHAWEEGDFALTAADDAAEDPWEEDDLIPGVCAECGVRGEPADPPRGEDDSRPGHTGYEAEGRNGIFPVAMPVSTLDPIDEVVSDGYEVCPEGSLERDSGPAGTAGQTSYDMPVTEEKISPGTPTFSFFTHEDVADPPGGSGEPGEPAPRAEVPPGLELHEWTPLERAEEQFLAPGQGGARTKHALQYDDVPLLVVDGPGIGLDPSEEDLEVAFDDEEFSGLGGDLELGDWFRTDDGELDALDEGLDLPEFEEEARQSPDVAAEPEDAAEGLRTARQKAASLVDFLDISGTADRERAVDYLIELFTHLRHPSTYRAVRRVVEDELDFVTLQQIVELRRVWAERPEWWVGRYGHARSVMRLSSGKSALTWSLAKRICIARGHFPPERMIDDAWLDEWLVLAEDQSGALDFRAFVDIKIGAGEAETLEVGLRAENGTGELIDAADWSWRCPDLECSLLTRPL